ncbi:MAG TPA: valine--tRNA ligase [Terriglobales bacterium]|nr:valine--tRNA ligase [Terriglobales bacterium]
MPHDLPKQYDPASIEPRWAEYWLRERLFECPTPGGAPAVFNILLPPPNVTGRMHMGHMLEHTISDAYVRWQRMRGRVALWLPGTDHAGIATQMLVERQLASEGVSRRQLGREKFVERVWQWKEHYGGAIVGQMKRLGESVDWLREYFTMDERLSRAVKECFVQLWDEGLIYRGTYMVNWCPRCQTAISDLEVVHDDAIGKLYEIRYPVAGRNGQFITVATTRPETMLGDTAVAVNPADERYRALHGGTILLPLAPERRRALNGEQVTREVPIILDELANPEFGTGAVKVTPAHDPNDYAAGKRHNLPQIDIFDETARVNANGGAYAGHDRFEARERVLHDLEAQGLLAGVKDHAYSIGKCDRCKTIVEPRISTQWFVAVNRAPKSGGATIAERAIEVAERGEITFVPENYKAIYLNWMRNIYDWCISRQLWWGHRIPAWHCAKCGEITVARETPSRCAHCASGEIAQDNDVLDTWFSSGLLPFTTFGWPEPTRDLKVFYPTSLLITGFDILFFWVARMIMLGCRFMAGHQQDAAIKAASGFGDRRDDSVPFRQVHIHALVRDAERQKMSKTKGNVLDPTEVTNQYGTDAVRFTLASMAAPGTDIAYNEKRTEGYRAFANKIWNAARFLFMNVDRAEQAGVFRLDQLWLGHGGGDGDGQPPAPPGPPALSHFQAAALEDRWILSRFSRTADQVNSSLAEFRFHEAAHHIYHFFWDDFCDWYIELLKLRFNFEEKPESAGAALRNAITIFEAALRLLSPFMPFLTEEIWHAIHEGKPPVKSIALAGYPQADARQVDLAAESELAIVQDLIVSIRNLRAELKVEPRERVSVRVFAGSEIRRLFEHNNAAIARLANGQVTWSEQSLSGAPGSRSTARFDVQLVYERKIDVTAERDRLTAEVAKYEQELGRAQAQLGNDKFLAKAPEHVVAGLRARAAELQSLLERNRNALEALR